MLRVHGRFAIGQAIRLCVSARWLYLKGLTPEQLATEQHNAARQAVALIATRALISNIRPEDLGELFAKHAGIVFTDWHLDDALDTVF